MNPQYEMFKIVGMDKDHPKNQCVLEAIEKLGFTIVFPGEDSVLCCMNEKTMEEYYCDIK